MRTPSDAALRHYQQAGYLTGMTVADLDNLYRLEGIETGDRRRHGAEGLHVLEGGSSLIAPVAGSAGFARLFCTLHAPLLPSKKPHATCV